MINIAFEWNNFNQEYFNKMKNQIRSIILFLCFSYQLNAQDQGVFSGSLELNGNFFMRDTAIGAANTPQYDNQLSGGDAWFNLNYNYKGFDFGLRFDAYHNSNLQNPVGSYSAQGIGYWHARKKINKLDITAGHIYDQIGSGIIFRTYEQRPLFIDNALVGLRLGFDLLEKDAGNLIVKGFVGRQKRPFSNNREDIIARAYQPIVKALSLEGFWGNEAGTISVAPGVGVINRTLDDGTMNLIVAEINTYAAVDSFIPKFNVYATTLYNTLTVKNFSWYIEGAFKTHEAIADPREGRLVDRTGNILYTSLAYSQKGIGITLEAKRTQNFSLRVSPLETAFNGMLNFLPPMQRQNTYRLSARYNSATQELGELAFQGDIKYSPKRTLNFNLNGAYISDLNNELLYSELHFITEYRKPQKYSMVAGFQFQQYNQEIYEEKPGVPLVKTYIPYIDFLYKFDKKKSLRTEVQYMYTEEDFGQWAFALLEFSIAPHWIFTTSAMVNVVPKKSDKIQVFPTAGVVYNYKTNRFGLSYVKQVEGIVCSGGICRYEPAFSGVKLNVTSTF